MRLYKGKHVDLEMGVILDSATIQIGDVVKSPALGLDAADDVADPIYGLVVGIVTPKGVPINQANTDDYDGTWTNSTQVYDAAATNETVDMIQALVRPLDGTETLSAEMDAALGTTTGSDLVGYYVSVLTTDSTKLDESTTHATNRLQFKIVDNGQGENKGQDPVLQGNNVLIRVNEVDVPRSDQA